MIVSYLKVFVTFFLRMGVLFAFIVLAERTRKGATARVQWTRIDCVAASFSISFFVVLSLP